MAKIRADALYAALRAAGIADNDTTRVVIDVQVGEPVKVYVERIGTDSLVNVIPTLIETRFDLVTTDEPALPANSNEREG